MLTVSMSHAGACIRQQFCERMHLEGEEPPPWLSTSAEEGTLHEHAIKDKLRSEGYTITENGQCDKGCGRGGIHVELQVNDILFAGHMDGVSVAPEKDAEDVLECKSMSMFEFKRWQLGGFENFPIYRTQIALYLAASKHDRAYYIVKDRNNGTLDRQYVYAHELNGTIDLLVKNIEVLDKALQINEMPEGIYEPDSFQCKRCSFRALCKVEQAPLSEATIDELNEATEEWYRGDRLVKEGEAKQKAAKQVFDRHIRAVNQPKVYYEGLKVSHIFVKEGIQYPKWKLVEKIPPETLQLAAEVKKAYDFVKVEEIEK